MLLRDLAQTGAARATRDGYLAVPARVAKANHVRRYYGSELGLSGDAASRTYGVVTPDTELFARDTMRSYAYRPLTVDHPAGGTVNAENYTQASVGFSGAEVARDGDFLMVPLLLADAGAQAAVTAGRKQISAGYTLERLDWTPGTLPSGEAFDAVARGIRCNHLACVEVGRAGPDVKLALDSATGKPTMDTSKITTLDAAKAELDRLSRENQSLAGQNAALLHTAHQRQQQGGGAALNDAHHARLRGEAMLAQLAMNDRKFDLSTAYGRSCERVANAWKGKPNAGV